MAEAPVTETLASTTEEPETPPVQGEEDANPKRQRRKPPGTVGSGDAAMEAGGEAADMAAGALVEAVAGSVLEAAGEEASIARLRGLPWSYGAKEVCEFLAGVSVNLQPEAVTMLHNAAGEAFVTLSTAAQLTEVLQANHQQIGRRYVEVFSSTTAEKVAACERNRATMRDDAGYRGVLRMRGLPFTASAEDIVAFFGSPPTLQLANVHIMRKADGRSSGDAYAVFDTEEAAVEAMKYDKQKLGARWVDLFQSNKGELYSLTSLGGIMLGGADGNGTTTPVVALGEGYSVVKLRGLPWSVTLEDIANFLSGISIPSGGVHLMNGPNGRPSGLAYVELSSEEDQAEALRRDKQSIGGRYIDVFSCSQTELQARLAGGLERGGGGGAAPSAADAHFAKLRGLPYQANEQQIAGFFQPLQVVAVQVAYNSSAQPSGFGFVQFRTPEDAALALQRSNQVLGSRYVEVFRCSRAEMEQARVHALSVMPYMRGHQVMSHPNGMQQHGAQRANGGNHNGHRAPSESAYAAYQAALQTLASRQPQSYGAPAQGAYPTAATYHGAEYAVANGAMSASNAGSYGASYANADYSGAAGGYAQGAAGYGQVAGGYGPGAGTATGGYAGSPAPAYASGGANTTQSYYQHPQTNGANGAAPPGYTAADYAQYSNYYYQQAGTYQ